MQNFLAAASQGTPLAGRPTFVLLQFETDESFGLFFINSEENILLCFMRSDNEFVDFATDVYPEQAVHITTSLDKICWLFLGWSAF